MPSTIWTIGHSTRSIDEFIALLVDYGIEVLADVRRFAGSRRFPQFGEGALRASLAEHRIAYHPLPALGGRRRPLPDSPNVAWRNASFRGYADHMASREFADGLRELVDVAHRARTALMCAEAVWWRCHRALIADALKTRGDEVIHILDAKHAVPHPYTAPARIVDGKLSYRTTAEDAIDSGSTSGAGAQRRPGIRTT